MKKVTTTLSVLLFCCWMTTTIYAQNEAGFSKKGRVLVESGYNLFAGFAGGSGATIFVSDGETITSLGFDGGYFISENFALKIRFGLLSATGSTLTNFSGGGKYYIAGRIPVELGAGLITGGGASDFLGNVSVGYGIGLAPNINLEPSVGLLFSEASLFKIGVNFAMFL